MHFEWTYPEKPVDPSMFRMHEFPVEKTLYDMYQCIHCHVLVPNLRNINWNLCIERKKNARV